MDKLFIIASNTLRTQEYLGSSCKNPLALEMDELISVEEEPWEQLEAAIAEHVLSRFPVTRLRIAAHMQCLAPDAGGRVERVFPEMAESLTERLGEMAALNTEVWGFKHMKESGIWSVLFDVADVLDDDPAGPRKREFRSRLWNTFQNPSQILLDEFRLAAHNFLHPSTRPLPSLELAIAALKDENTRSAGQDFDKARRMMPQNTADARQALATLHRLAEGCTDQEACRSSERILTELDQLLTSIPAIEGSFWDAENLKAWGKRANDALERLQKDLVA
jgi:hypothetical protein